MGEAEIDEVNKELRIHSHIITYGNASDEQITERIRQEIEFMWNAPAATVTFQHKLLQVKFKITAIHFPNIVPEDIYSNLDPRNNYFRIEKFAHGNISFVDGLGSNSGYFLLENLYEGSTTAAHEYGHTLGLEHPGVLDIRGEGVPGIMYPRGTLVDAIYQYEPSRPAGVTGGTMHPQHRKVRQEDIDDLRLGKISFKNGKGIVGDFTNIYHWDHVDIPPEEFMRPPIFG
jgi:hypothetical protein